MSQTNNYKLFNTVLNAHIGRISFAFLPSRRDPSDLSWAQIVELNLLISSLHDQACCYLLNYELTRGFPEGFSSSLRYSSGQWLASGPCMRLLSGIIASSPETCNLSLHA